jgi:aconitate hydratase
MNTQYRKQLPGTRWITSTPAPPWKPSARRLGHPALHLPRAGRKPGAPLRSGHAHRFAAQLIERKRDLDFPWFPARVVCHDILGQTALVDLAGLRDAIADRAATRPRSIRWCRCS